MSEKFGLVANLEIRGTLELAQEVLEYLEPEHSCILDSKLAEELNQPERGAPISELDTDIIITLGGDGTILRTLQETDKKILGINAGVLGFLTEISRDNLEFGLQRLTKGDYVVDSRIKLKTTLNDKRLEDAVNEAVIHTAQIAKIQSYQVLVDEQRAENIRADGIIIATPTGSTCYVVKATAARWHRT